MQKYSQKLSQISKVLPRFKSRVILIFAGSVLGIATSAYFVAFLWPREITYSYASTTVCYTNPVLLPKALDANKSSYQVSYQADVLVKNYPLFSSRSCLELSSLPNEMASEQVKLGLLDSRVFAQNISVKSAPLPKLSTIKSSDELVSTQETLKLKFDQPDKVFRYQISVNEEVKSCEYVDRQLQCSLTGLNLDQSQTYDVSFQRIFNDKNVGTVLKTSIKTVDPVSITGQTISPGSLVYDSPSEIIITTDKKIESYKSVGLESTDSSGEQKKIDLTIEQAENKLVIKPAKPLPRESSYSLKIDGITSTDKGFLPEPYQLNFKTSGGPNVSGINAPGYGVQIDKNFVLNFDYDLAKDQDFNQLIAIETANGKSPANIIYNNKSITLKPASPLPKCTAFTVKVAPGIKNIYGIPASSGWSFTSRTLCQEVFGIGTSLQGRTILAYRFGNGPSKVVYIGTTHGDEKGSKYLLDSWINELEANYSKIPSHRTIVVVPLINPDGFAAGSRTNSRNVDLNRNFPANSWKADVIMPSGNLVAGGGGSSALSEPESKAIADYVLNQNPRLLLTYHSKGSLVVANEAGDSATLANIYGKNSGYYATSESKLGTTFNYDTTGALENWLYDKYSVPTLLIELKTHDTNEFSRNKAAMWNMATL